MNCKQVMEILPELAAGELDNITTTKAEAHVRHCPQCAFQLEKYREVLNAVSGPWETLEEPDDLRLPEWEERRSPLIKRLGFAMAVAAVILAAVVMLPRLNQPAQPERQTQVKVPANMPPSNEFEAGKTQNPPSRIAPLPCPPLAKGRESSKEDFMPSPASNSVAGHKAADQKPPVKIEKQEKTVVQEIPPAPEPVPQDEPDTAAPVIVVATSTPRPPQPPTIVIESVDHATGQVSVHEVVYDEDRNGRESEIKYAMKDSNKWREEL